MATIHYSVREFICFADLDTPGLIYVEEVTGGSLSRIEDDKLAEELEAFLEERGILDIRPWEQLRTYAGRSPKGIF